MSSFKKFLRWCKVRNVVPTLETMQERVVFYHDKDIDMLKLGCTLPKLANIVHTNLQIQTSAPSRRQRDL